jgi:ATP-dependent RNA helicase DeaD
MADAIHSDLKQSARDRVMRSFREGKIQVLVATDIAARGIDVKGVDAVINYDVPKNMEYYVHRIGRTARAKMTGSAFTLIANDVKGNIRTIERHTNDKLAEHTIEGIDFNEAPPPREKREFNRDRNERFNRGERHEHPKSNFVNRTSDGTTTRFFATIGFKDNMDNNSLREYLTANVGIPTIDIIDV